MERKYQIIYIWSFIIVSGVVLLLLYTPMGGNLHKAAYAERYRYMAAPGVNYQTQVGEFIGAYSGSHGNSGQTEAYMSENFRNGMLGENSSVIGGTNGVSAGNGFGGGSSLSGASSGSKGSVSSGGGFGGMTLALGGGSSSASSSVGGGGGMPFSSSGSGSVMQRATDGTTADDGNLDPGGEDGLGDPLPLKDDLIVLTLLSLIYTLYRLKKK